MSSSDLFVHEDIAQASTLPVGFYTDPSNAAAIREKVFVPSWQMVATTNDIKVPGQVYPFLLLDDYVGEPLVLTRDFDDTLRCLSNVCTHRGTLVVECPGNHRHLRCRYHGRRFALDGSFESMPEFDGVQCFPSAKDDLANVSLGTFKQFVFVSISPEIAFDRLIGDMEKRIGWLPFEELVFDPVSSREYLVNAHWALYVDNYLEGFHIPYVHAGLSKIIDYGSYSTELLPYGTLQLGLAKEGEQRFDPPAGSPDHGKPVGAFYYWLYPNTMFSIYPWGCSINVVKPVNEKRTRVAFLNFLWDKHFFEESGFPTMDRVEREDEQIVESIQKGMRSRFYERGRFSPKRETGVHHFHRLLARAVG